MRLVRGDLGELHGRRRTREEGPPRRPRAVPGDAPRRLARHREYGSARRGLPRRARGARGGHGAGLDLRPPLLDGRRGPDVARSPAPAVHPGGPRSRGLTRAARAGAARTPARPRERLELRDVADLDDPGGGVPRGARAPERLRSPPRREQRLRERDEPRARPAALARGDPDRKRLASPPGRALGGGAASRRHARPPGATRGVGALPRGGAPLRRGVVARGVGRSDPRDRRRPRGARSGSRDRSRGPGGA